MNEYRLLFACASGLVLSCASAPVEEIPNRHERPIIEEDGKTLLWAGEEDGAVQWFDMTGSKIDPTRFQYGIGRDTISSIDDPIFRPYGDELLKARGVTGETPVLGVEVAGEARAYPVSVMRRHEVVNDRFGDEAFAVLW